MNKTSRLALVIGLLAAALSLVAVVTVASRPTHVNAQPLAARMN